MNITQLRQELKPLIHMSLRDAIIVLHLVAEENESLMITWGRLNQAIAQSGDWRQMQLASRMNRKLRFAKITEDFF